MTTDVPPAATVSETADDVLRRASAEYEDGRIREAELRLRALLRREQQHPGALHLLGLIAYRTAHYDSAIELIGQAARLRPNDVACHLNLGSALRAKGRLPEAEASLRRALELQPNSPEAHNNLGMVLKAGGRIDDAIGQYREAIALKEEFPEAHNNLGNALAEKGDRAGAIRVFERAIALKPDFADAHSNLGAAYIADGEHEHAVACYREAIRLHPEFANAHFNLAFALKQQGAYDAALKHFRQATRLNPGLAKVNRNDSLRLLCTGRLAEGWREYEWRTSVRSLGPFTDIVWDGQDLAGKTVLVWGEQGIGEQILFGSCIPELIARAGHCVIECDFRLAPLFQRSFPAASVHPGPRYAGSEPVEWTDFSWLANFPPIDYFVLAGSLPRFFRPTIESFPTGNRFLAPDPVKVAFWRARLSRLNAGLKVGVNWRSIDLSGIRKSEHPPFESWAPVLSLEGVRFVSLQAAATEEEFVAFKRMFGEGVRSMDDLDVLNDLDGSAALMAALDAVVATQTNVSEMAGGLGLPVWRVAPGEPGIDWTCLGTDRRPWFPTMTALFGRDAAELTQAFERVAAGLRGLMRAT